MLGRRIRTVLGLATLLSGICLCGGASIGVERAFADDLLPVTASLTGGTFTATFSGDDAGLSFSVDTDSLSAFVTGGGWIPLTSGGKGSFGFVAAGPAPDGSFRGHLVWINHDLGLVMQSTSIALRGGCIDISGNGDSNFGPVTFDAQVADNGEPGTNDTFTIGVFGAVIDVQSGTLSGGDIQTHGFC